MPRSVFSLSPPLSLPFSQGQQMATQIQELKYNCAMSHTLICRAYRLACTGPQTGLAMSSTVCSLQSTVGILCSLRSSAAAQPSRIL